MPSKSNTAIWLVHVSIQPDISFVSERGVKVNLTLLIVYDHYTAAENAIHHKMDSEHNSSRILGKSFGHHVALNNKHHKNPQESVLSES